MPVDHSTKIRQSYNKYEVTFYKVPNIIPINTPHEDLISMFGNYLTRTTKNHPLPIVYIEHDCLNNGLIDFLLCLPCDKKIGTFTAFYILRIDKIEF